VSATLFPSLLSIHFCFFTKWKKGPFCPSERYSKFNEKSHLFYEFSFMKRLFWSHWSTFLLFDVIQEEEEATK